MECKLAAERKQTENLSLELEAARFQLQVLDLSSHSLLCTDIENVSNCCHANEFYVNSLICGHTNLNFPIKSI